MVYKSPDRPRSPIIENRDAFELKNQYRGSLINAFHSAKSNKDTLHLKEVRDLVHQHVARKRGALFAAVHVRPIRDLGYL